MATDTGRSPEPPLGLRVTLMHPTLVARPFHRQGWIYEEKYDEWRLVGYKRDGQAWLLNRTHRDHTRRFPALAAAIAALAPPTLILDGEVVIFDAQLISRVEWLRQRDPEAVATPPIYMVFDLLRTGPHDLRREPLRTRRAALERLVDGQTLILLPGGSPLAGADRLGHPTVRVRGPGRQGASVNAASPRLRPTEGA
jgi:ATP-dependent DNA ligase